MFLMHEVSGIQSGRETERLAKHFEKDKKAIAPHSGVRCECSLSRFFYCQTDAHFSPIHSGPG